MFIEDYDIEEQDLEEQETIALNEDDITSMSDIEEAFGFTDLSSYENY